jgi:hypothetical protein
MKLKCESRFPNEPGYGVSPVSSKVLGTFVGLVDQTYGPCAVVHIAYNAG